MTKAKSERKPWTGLEWGIFIAAAALLVFYLLGWRLIGLKDILRFARDMASGAIHWAAGVLRGCGRFIRRLF